MTRKFIPMMYDAFDRGFASVARATAVAAALCFAAAAPVMAADQPPTNTPAMTPAPAAAPPQGEFDNSCTFGLTKGHVVKTDCSINWTAPDGKVYCFSRESSKEAFLQNPTENIQKAKEFFLAKDLTKDNAPPATPAAGTAAAPAAAPAATGPTKEFTEDDVNAAVKKVVDERTKDGAFVFRDPKLNADLHPIFDQI